MLPHCAILAVLFAFVNASPTSSPNSIEGSGWIVREHDQPVDPAPLTDDPTVSVEKRDVKCVSSKVCAGDHECGDRGSCLGLLAPPGTCNCAACVNLWTCRDDRDCGGLKGACDTQFGTCRCVQALDRHSFGLFKTPLATFCSRKKCREDHREEDCLGLPCNTGRCYCKYSWIDN